MLRSGTSVPVVAAPGVGASVASEAGGDATGNTVPSTRAGVSSALSPPHAVNTSHAKWTGIDPASPRHLFRRLASIASSRSHGASPPGLHSVSHRIDPWTPIRTKARAGRPRRVTVQESHRKMAIQRVRLPRVSVDIRDVWAVRHFWMTDMRGETGRKSRRWAGESRASRDRVGASGSSCGGWWTGVFARTQYGAAPARPTVTESHAVCGTANGGDAIPHRLEILLSISMRPSPHVEPPGDPTCARVPDESGSRSAVVGTIDSSQRGVRFRSRQGVVGDRLRRPHPLRKNQ